MSPPDAAPAVGPVAAALLDELTNVAGRRRRLLAAEADTALCDVAPELRHDPGRRARLADLLAELAAAGLVTPSVSVDTSRATPLPAFVTLTGTPPRSAAVDAGVVRAWRPELAWAHDMALTTDEVDVLTGIQDHLRNRTGAPVVVPHRERSLELFGDEKRLDRLSRSRLFAPGRLTFELLSCWWAPPPLAVRALDGAPDGAPVVVTENSAGWWSLPPVLGERAAAIAYGAGASFAQSVASLADLGNRPVLYIGDLDADGVAIPARAATAAAAAGVAAPEPFTELWQALADAADTVGHPVTPVPAEVAAELADWFGPTQLAASVAELLTSGIRVAQEALTGDRLRRALRHQGDFGG